MYTGSRVVAGCNESKGITAFGFLSWIMCKSHYFSIAKKETILIFPFSSLFLTVLFYFVFLTSLTFRQHLRGYTGIWKDDVTETDFTAVGANNNPQIVYDNKAVYPNQYPPGGTPVVQQGGLPYQTGSPYQQPPQGVTGSYTHPQGQGGASPYPQV